MVPGGAGGASGVGMVSAPDLRRAEHDVAGGQRGIVGADHVEDYRRRWRASAEMSITITAVDAGLLLRVGALVAAEVENAVGAAVLGEAGGGHRGDAIANLEIGVEGPAAIIRERHRSAPIDLVA